MGNKKLCGLISLVIFKFSDKKVENLVVDALSRQFHSEDSFLLTMSSPILDLLTTFHEFYARDAEGQTIVTYTTHNSSEDKLYKFFNSLIYYKDMLFIPDIQDIHVSKQL